jgi:hypothetical protein
MIVTYTNTVILSNAQDPSSTCASWVGLGFLLKGADFSPIAVSLLPPLRITASRDPYHRARCAPTIGYLQNRRPSMSPSGFQLNRFERILFKVAIALAAVLVLVRLGAMLLLAFLHHAR